VPAFGGAAEILAAVPEFLLSGLVLRLPTMALAEACLDSYLPLNAFLTSASLSRTTIARSRALRRRLRVANVVKPAANQASESIAFATTSISRS
jgi:hypothetical protein